MKKSIGIIGSTGSIGTSTIEVIKKNRLFFNVIFLTANKNYKKLIKQAILLKPKYIFIKDSSKIEYIKKKIKRYNILVLNDFESLIKIQKKKIDYIMSSISGLSGLYYNLLIIKKTKKILMANKESIICGWVLIKKELEKHSTQLIPIDSEHYSIYELLKSVDYSQIKDIYITASGGPFLKKRHKDLKSITINEALNHPKWKMGKKISIDSSNLMNKVFEVMEAYRLFDMPKKKIKIIIHPEAYVHAILNMNNGISKCIIHNNNMQIPILSSLEIDNLKISSKIINFKLNKNQNFNFDKVNKKQFPSVNILDNISNKSSLFDTVIISANDALVELFLNKKISYHKISKNLEKITRLKEFQKYKKLTPKNYQDIYNLNKIVRLKTYALSVI